MTWREWLRGKSSWEVFQEIGKRTKAGVMTPKEAKVIWSTYKEMNDERIYQPAFDPKWWDVDPRN